jgi:hypothetical protein
VKGRVEAVAVEDSERVTPGQVLVGRGRWEQRFEPQPKQRSLLVRTVRAGVGLHHVFVGGQHQAPRPGHHDDRWTVDLEWLSARARGTSDDLGF